MPLASVIFETREARLVGIGTNRIPIGLVVTEKYGSIAMNSLRCPHLDLLGHEQIEAYRQIGDTDTNCLAQHLEEDDAIFAVHHKMAEHRQVCYLCMQAEIVLNSTRGSVGTSQPAG
jgi:hypothetical protein